jgi:ribosomal-protein-alanine N-acetyltransferase
MQQPPVTLRPARADDAPSMSRMSRDFIESGLDWRYTPQRIAALIADPQTCALTACCHDHDGDGAANGLCGYAMMQFGDEQAHLVLMCVAPAWRRQGIGRRLLEWLVASARVAGIASIDLELRLDNRAAGAFYETLGFAETAVVPGYYQGRIAARRMRRRLRAPDPPPG